MKINLLSFTALAKLMGMHRSAPVATTQTYTGSVAGYPVSLTLTIFDNLAHGTLVYIRSGIPIRVEGTFDGTSLTIHEFDKKGRVTGIYSGKHSQTAYAGTWCSPSVQLKEMPFSFNAAGEAN